MDLFASFLLSAATHLLIALLLILYVPVSLACRLLWRLLLRPFSQEDMRGKVVLITGASSGIGEQVAYQYARRGALLAVTARRADALRAVARKARDRGAPDVLVVVADVTVLEDSRRAVDETISHFGRLDHLVVNAGVWSTCLFEEIASPADFNQVMDVNFWGSVYPTYYAVPHIKKSRGRIVVNASLAGRLPTARMTFYNASKAATIMFFESLRSELGGGGVGITMVTLGYVASELTRGKAVQANGELKVDEDNRDIQIGAFPVGSTERCAEVIVGGACSGDKYITWPGWYKPFIAVASLAPELMEVFSQCYYAGGKVGENSSGVPLGKKILNMKGIKELLYPDSILSPSSASIGRARAHTNMNRGTAYRKQGWQPLLRKQHSAL